MARTAHVTKPMIALDLLPLPLAYTDGFKVRKNVLMQCATIFDDDMDYFIDAMPDVLRHRLLVLAGDSDGLRMLWQGPPPPSYQEGDVVPVGPRQYYIASCLATVGRVVKSSMVHKGIVTRVTRQVDPPEPPVDRKATAEQIEALQGLYPIWIVDRNGARKISKTDLVTGWPAMNVVMTPNWLVNVPALLAGAEVWRIPITRDYLTRLRFYAADLDPTNISEHKEYIDRLLKLRG